MAFALQLILNALLVSALYGLMSVSYVLAHGVAQRINLAFGAVAMATSYTTANLAVLLQTRYPGAAVGPLLMIALAAAVAHGGALGFAIDRMTVRPFIRAKALAVLIATLGFAVALEEAARLGNGNQERWLPRGFDETLRLAGGEAFPVQIALVQAIVTLVALGLAGGICLLIWRSRFGRIWRAAGDDLAMVELTGVDIGRTVMLTMILAGAAAGAAGGMTTLAYGVASYYGSFVLALKTLFVAAIGGMNSIVGALLGALILGCFETFWTGYAPGAYRDIASFAALTALLLLRPSGLLGRAP